MLPHPLKSLARCLRTDTPGASLAARQQLSRRQFQRLSSGDFASEPKVSGDEFTKKIRKKRRAIRDERLRWTRAEIPYRFVPYAYSASEEYDILKAMTEWERYTCLKFRPASKNDVNRIVIEERGGGCYSMLGMIGKEQTLSLSRYGCRYPGLYLHEIGHALGLIHEHQRPDRDNHIQVLFQNVQPSIRKFYEKHRPEEVNSFGVPYDVSSVMHYEASAFASQPGYPTYQVIDKSKDVSNISVYLKDLAFSDVEIVNLMYNCSASCPKQTQCQGEGVLDQNCRCICPDGTDSCQPSGTSTKTQPQLDLRTCSDVAEHGYCENILDDWKCFVWANQGECQRDPEYMKYNCNKACTRCDQKNTETSACKDLYLEVKCSRWKERGECASNAEWMKRHCRKTCNFCGDPGSQPEVGCTNQDDDSKCDVMAHEGKCVLHGRWMMAHCRRSCRACAGNTVYHDDACYDKNAFECGHLVQDGQCSKNKAWMISNCRKSCGMCGTNDLQPYIMINCTDVEGREQCWENKQQRKCQTDEVSMTADCAKTCGKCPASFYEHECMDVYAEKDCMGLARRGDCRTESQSMKSICKKTCGFCTDCIDKFKAEDCARWAKSGECDKNPTCMIDNCRKSCNKCMEDKEKSDTTVKPATTEQPNPDCFDKHNTTACKDWAEDGLCEGHSVWMIPNCRKSCGKCTKGTNQLDKEQPDKENPVTLRPDKEQPVTSRRPTPDARKEKPKSECVDEYHDKKACQNWAQDGHCKKNPSWMIPNCQKSCGRCS